ncbi:hypothetical protein JCM11251_004812 [Rhodosporidiobolus azoricus]
MVTNFTRFNVRSERPSPHIDWITVDDTTAEPQKALAHLETLSAFVAPLQHRYGLHVTHLSHFPANKEYAGRNYGKGEHVLVVLNDASGRCSPTAEYLPMAVTSSSSLPNSSKAQKASRQPFPLPLALLALLASSTSFRSATSLVLSLLDFLTTSSVSRGANEKDSSSPGVAIV